MTDDLSMQHSVPFKLLEINTPMIWHWPHFISVMEVIRKYGFNGLIIHQQNILSVLARPSRFCKNAKVENLNHEREDTLLYLQRVSQYCAERNIQLWLQGEACPEDGKLKQKFPEYFWDNLPREDDSFLHLFYRDTIGELIGDLPVLSGLILSLHTPLFHQSQWKTGMKTLYDTLRSQGKKLVLRDYQDDNWPRQQLQTTLRELPDDVRASIKATAHAYRPGFANNPDIIDYANHRKWIEFDLWGIDYGWSLLPCFLVDEIQGRISWATSVIGAELEAVTARISWEWISNSSLLDSLNEINLLGLQQSGVQREILLQDWLQQHGVITQDRREREQLYQLFTGSYDWMCKTPYLLGRLLHHHSQLPQNYEQALQLLHAETRSANWAQSFQPLLPADDEAFGHGQLSLISIEQEQVAFLAQHLRQKSTQLRLHSSLPPELKEMIFLAWERAYWYTRLFSVGKQAIVSKLYIEQYGRSALNDSLLINKTAELRQFTLELGQWLQQNRQQHPHYLTMLLNPERLHKLADSL